MIRMGTEVDLHTPHWHGNDVTVNGMRMDLVNLLPASMVVADMVPDNVGIWLFHCHVNEHLTDRDDHPVSGIAVRVFKAELVRDKGPWRSIDDLEIAVAEYIDWFNHRRPARRDRPRSAR